MALQVALNTPIDDASGFASSVYYITCVIRYLQDERQVYIQTFAYASKADFEADKRPTWIEGVPAELRAFRDDITAGQYSTVDLPQLQAFLAELFEDGSNSPVWGAISDLAGITWTGLKGVDPLNTVTVELI